MKMSYKAAKTTRARVQQAVKSLLVVLDRS